jgi:hypothetical protein
VRSARHVACVGKKKIAYRIFVGKTDRRMSLERHKHRREDKKMGFIEISGDVEWIGLIWLRIGASGGLL